MNETPVKHKRCRYCGGKKKSLYICGITRLRVKCGECGSTGPYAETEDEAWALWDAPRPKRKRKKAGDPNAIRLTVAEYQRLVLMASDLAQLQIKPAVGMPRNANANETPASDGGGMPRNAITDLLTACLEGAQAMAYNEVLNVTDLQDLLNQCINKNNNAYIGGAPGRAHHYAQIASVHEGVYR